MPDADFDRAFLEEITSSDGLTVLWGPPGRGKSTYLSHCVAGINLKSTVCIRHHYFLSLEDRSEGRFHYYAIAQSLKHQLEEAIPDLEGPSRDLGELLETAAFRLEGEGRRLIVVIDGLDHVWRDHRDHEDMEALFDALLPLPDNVRLVVGNAEDSQRAFTCKTSKRPSGRALDRASIDVSDGGTPLAALPGQGWQTESGSDRTATAQPSSPRSSESLPRYLPRIAASSDLFFRGSRPYRSGG